MFAYTGPRRGSPGPATYETLAQGAAPRPDRPRPAPGGEAAKPAGADRRRPERGAPLDARRGKDARRGRDEGRGKNERRERDERHEKEEPAAFRVLHQLRGKVNAIHKAEAGCRLVATTLYGPTADVMAAKAEQAGAMQAEILEKLTELGRAMDAYIVELGAQVPPEEDFGPGEAATERSAEGWPVDDWSGALAPAPEAEVGGAGSLERYEVDVPPLAEFESEGRAGLAGDCRV